MVHKFRRTGFSPSIAHITGCSPYYIEHNCKAVVIGSFHGRRIGPSEIGWTNRCSAADAAPIVVIAASLHPFRKRRIRISVRASGYAMFDRIVVQIIQVPVEVVVVADGMIVEPLLPDTAAGMKRAIGCYACLTAAGQQPGSGEAGLEIEKSASPGGNSHSACR